MISCIIAARTRVLVVVLLPPALMLADRALGIVAGGLLGPLSATAQVVRQLGVPR